MAKKKPAKQEAYDEGKLARIARAPLSSCPYPAADPKAKEWEKGWNDQLADTIAPDALEYDLKAYDLQAELEDLEQLSDAQRLDLSDWLDKADELDGTAFRAAAPPFVQVTDGRLTFVAPVATVADNEHQADLAQLMTDLDNVGVSLDETQWRALNLSEESERSVRTWVKYRMQDPANRSPLPLCLQPFASEALKAEWAPYAADQERARQERLAVQFDKPSVVAPGEDDEGKIKVVAKAAKEILPGGLADRLFRYKRCKIQFSTRSPDQWDQGELFESHPIYTAISDVSGYKASRHETSFSFLVDQEELTVQAAFKELWGFHGTVIVEVLGEAVGKKRNDESDGEATAPDPRQQSLPGTADTDAEPQAPAIEYLLAKAGDLQIRGTVYHEDAGWFVDIEADTPGGWETGNADIKDEMHPRDTAAKALETRVGQIIDHWANWKYDENGLNGDVTSILDQLRTWLKELDKGTAPEAIVSMVLGGVEA